jgi:uncharacterized membrane protein
MKAIGHLWAVGYDDVARAEQARDELLRLEDTHYLILEDTAIVVRLPDGSFKVDHESLPTWKNILGCSIAGFLAGLVVLQPLGGAAIGAAVGAAGSALGHGIGIGDDFIREVQALMKPGTAALFVLDDEGDMDVILYRLRGLGGTVLKTNVDVARAREIQATLSARG